MDHSKNVSKKKSQPPTVHGSSLHIADTLRTGNEHEHTLFQFRDLKGVRQHFEPENIDPTKKAASPKKIYVPERTFPPKKKLFSTIVEYNDIFTRNQLDIGINNIFKVKLTPKDDRSPYTQSLAVPINLREDLTVAHALMQRNSRTTTISFFKRANQLIGQRNQNGKCRLLVDLLIINELDFDDYTKNNHPVST